MKEEVVQMELEKLATHGELCAECGWVYNGERLVEVLLSSPVATNDDKCDCH